ncbi:Uncharacterized protein Fot_01114 [Forsythia ovata]|uniref:Uncharacterized protein n=1 Tax=Forsythia ovata TaxID=205694 RepID=A0ABD1X3W9_9LAMI
MAMQSTTFGSPEDGLDAVEEIQALIWKAKECSIKRGKTLAHAFSQQMRPLDEDRFSGNNKELDENSPCLDRTTVDQFDRNVCSQTYASKSDCSTLLLYSL